MPVFGGIALLAGHFLDDIAACIDSNRVMGMEQACKIFRHPFHRLSVAYDYAGRGIAVRIEPGGCNQPVHHIISEFLCGIADILDADRSLLAEVAVSGGEWREGEGGVPRLSRGGAAEREGVLSAQSPLSDARFREAKEGGVLAAAKEEDECVGGDGVS